jgi:chromosome segregation ATPase
MTELIKRDGSVVIERTPDVIAAEIRFIDSQARQYVLQSAIEIGKRLIEAKGQVAHGEWGKWLEDNVSYSQSSANNFMRVAEEYENNQSLANLSYTQAVALLALPAEEREAFASENNVSEMSSRELQAAIRKQQELQKQVEEEQDKLRAEQLAREEEGKKRSALFEQYQKEVELRKTEQQRLLDLEAQLEKAKQSGDDKAVAKMKTELRKAEKAKQEQEEKVAELQKQIEAAKESEEQRISERLKQREQELAEAAKAREAEQAMQIAALQEQADKLTQQVARANNEQFLRAKIALDQVIKDGEALVQAIATVTEPDEQVKLKTAAGKVIDKLRSMV